LLVGFLNRLDNTNSNGLTHITDSETSERGVVGEGLNTHGLGWNHLNDGSITRLDELGGVLNGLSGTTINLLQDLRELAGNVGSVAIQDWCVTSTNLTRVVKDDNLGVEGLSSLGRTVKELIRNFQAGCGELTRSWSHQQRYHDGFP
jgi:hypothetical protein